MYLNLTSNKNVLDVNINLPFDSNRCKWYITNFNMRCNMYYLTEDDWIEFEYINENDEVIKIRKKFDINISIISTNDLIYLLNLMLREEQFVYMNFSILQDGFIHIRTGLNMLHITDCSSRFKILLHLDYIFNKIIGDDITLEPVDFTYGGLMMLISNNTSDILTNDSTRSIACIMPGYYKYLLPINIQYNNESVIKHDSTSSTLTHLYFELVDRNFEPVHLLENFNITMYIKPND